MKSSFILVFFGVLCAASNSVFAATVTPSSGTTTANSTMECTQHTDCESCVKDVKCVFCNDDKACKKVLAQGIFNAGKVCSSLMNGSWGTCTVNMMALIIGVSVVGGVLLISICACICCCCCCKNSAKQKLKWMRQDAASERKSEERKAKYAERRAEREAKNNEIRKKYGLFKDGQGGYQRMEDGA